MAGIDRIKDRILGDAREQADEMLKKAQADADSMIARASAEGEKEADRILRKADQDAASISERAASAADLDRRTRMLAAKQEMIAGVLASAEKALEQMPGEKYFPMLLKLVERYALPKKGEMLLSRKDREAIPAGFAERVAEKAKEKGGELVISERTCDIAGGFILDYGGIEENCSLRAMFDARRDVLSDKVNRILFS